MASREHLTILKRGVEEWNAWRREHGDIRPELREANLRRAKLGEANLRGANLRRAKLGEANLRGANLHEADLYGADLRWATLNGADLSGANLNVANLNGANLSGVDLRGVNGLTQARLDEAHIDSDTQLPAVE